MNEMLTGNDQRLIAALRRDGRASVSQLAGELGLSRATIRARMQRLTEAGEILGYTAVLKGDVAEMPVRAIMLIGVEGRGAERVVARLRAMPEVSAIHTTNGRWDLIAELGTETLASLDDILRRIRLIDGIATSETNLLLATRRSARIARPD